MPGNEHRPCHVSTTSRFPSALPLALVLSLAFVTSACGDSATSPSTDAPSATQPASSQPTQGTGTLGVPGTSGAPTPGVPSGEPQVIWTAQITQGGKAPIGVGPDGVIWVAGQGGAVHALDIEDGSDRWSTSLEGTNQTTAPIAYGDALLVALSQTGNAPSDAAPPRIVALSQDEGTQLWEIPLDENPFMAPLVEDEGETLIIGATGGVVYEIDLAARSAEVLADVGTSVRTNLLQVGEAIIMGTQGGDAVAITRDGEELWRREIGGPVLGSPASDGAGNVVFGTFEGEAVSLDPASGEVAWRTELDGSVGTPLPVNAELTIVGSRTLAGLSPTDGSVVWEVEDAAFSMGIAGRMAGAPDGTIRLASTSGTVQARDREGALIWSWRSRGEARPGVVLTPEGDTLVATSDGVVARLR